MPSPRLQLRLISCHVAGVLALLVAIPPLLAGGLEIRNLVSAWFLGVALYLAIAITAGLIWSRRIAGRPMLWALAAPAVFAVAIYLLLGSLSSFDPGDSRLALEASLLGGLCSAFSSAFFVLWMVLAPVAPFPKRGSG